MTGFRLEPVDMLFFRATARPSADSAPQDGVDSLFPPPPSSDGGRRVAGRLARAHGWNGHGRWPEDICRVLGDGLEDPGRLSLDGPFVLHDDEPLFRAPAAPARRVRRVRMASRCCRARGTDGNWTRVDRKMLWSPAAS